MSGVRLYCARHRTVETVTAVEAEALIYGLSAALSDEETAPEDVHHREDPMERLYAWCPIEALDVLSDGEMYAEHITNLTELRRAGARSQSSASTGLLQSSRRHSPPTGA